MKSFYRLEVNLLTLLVACLLVLMGCSPSEPQKIVVTQDPAEIVEMVIGTLNVQQTEQALLLYPSSTPEPTATLSPSETPQPTSTSKLVPTNTPEASQTPEATLTNTTVPILAQALYSTTYPGNRREYIPNEGFGLALGFQNIGSIAWEPGFYVKIVSFEGEITVQQEAATSQSVAPGQKIEFDLWAFGSETLGRHVWYFQLYTASGIPVPGGYISFSYESK